LVGGPCAYPSDTGDDFVPAGQLRVRRNDRRNLGVNLFDMPLNPIKAPFVLTLEERQR
jgi:hypothetical protein